MSFHTPLRYPGGKGRLSRYVSELINLNDLNDGCYVEPFCGGSGIALTLLFGEKVKNIFLNDLDRSIYAFWYSSTKETEKLCRLIRDTPINMDTWYLQRAVQENKENADIIELGFSTFFLNRTNRSGILSAGVIGGKAQAGEWKIDARYKKDVLIKRIEKVGQYSKRIRISNLDVIDFIQKKSPKLPEKTLIYFDPPYYNKAQQLYKNHFQKKDHAIIAKIIQKNISQPWIVSYDNVPEISDLYAEYDQETFALNYSANQHYEGSELMIFKDGLITPEEVYASRGMIA